MTISDPSVEERADAQPTTERGATLESHRRPYDQDAIAEERKLAVEAGNAAVSSSELQGTEFYVKDPIEIERLCTGLDRRGNILGVRVYESVPPGTNKPSGRILHLAIHNADARLRLAYPAGTAPVGFFAPRARAAGEYADPTHTLYWAPSPPQALLLDSIELCCIGLIELAGGGEAAPRWSLPASLTDHVRLRDRHHVLVVDRVDRSRNRDSARHLARILLDLGAASVGLAHSHDHDFDEIDGHFVRVFGAEHTRLVLSHPDDIEPPAADVRTPENPVQKVPPLPAKREVNEKHAAQLTASGLSPETVELARIYSEHDPHTIAALLRKHSWQRDRGSALIFPFFQPGDSEPYAYRVRPDRPRVETKGTKNREIKYEQPTGSEMLVYLPPRACAGGWYTDTKRTLYWTEGEKKALHIDQTGVPCIGLTGTSNAHDVPHKEKTKEWRLHPFIREHVVVADREHVICFDAREPDPSGKPSDEFRKAQRLTQMLLDAGARNVRFITPPSADLKGIDDYGAAHGPAAVLQLLAAAKPIDPAPKKEAPQRAADDHRLEFVISTRWGETIEAVLATMKDHPRVRQRGGVLVHVTRSHAPSGRPGATAALTARALPKSLLGVEISNAVALLKETSKGTRLADPPTWLLAAIHDRRQWNGIHALTAVVEASVFLADGRILAQPGFDTGSGIHFEPLNGEVPRVPDSPTTDDVRRARELIESVVVDFPFTDHRAGEAFFAAAIGSIVARYSFDGPVPMFLVDAAAPGSGKGLLVSTAVLIATGRMPSVMQFSDDEGERRKAITTLAVEGSRVALFDNVGVELGGEALCAALTSTRWSGRLLGLNTTYDGPLDTVFLATGNNASLGEDMTRRSVYARLEPHVERPEERAGFAHPNLAAWVRENCTELLAAVLTILRAYHRAGRPSIALPPAGSFEEWSRAVREPLVWAGFSDPFASRKAMSSATSGCESDKGRLVAAWSTLTKLCPGGLTAARALKLVYPELGPHEPESARDPLPTVRDVFDSLSSDGKRPSARSLGRYLAQCRGRVFGGVRLDVVSAAHDVQVWQATRVGAAAAQQPPVSGQATLTPQNGASMSAAEHRSAEHARAAEAELRGVN